MFFKLLLFVYIFDLPIILHLEGFELLSSSPFFSDRRFVGLRWNRSTNVILYTLSCPNEDCQNKTSIGNVDSTLFRIFTRIEVIVTLTAIYQCNTSTAQVIVPQVETPTFVPTTPPIVSTGTYTITCTYFLNIQRMGRSYLDNV